METKQVTIENIFFLLSNIIMARINDIYKIAAKDVVKMLVMVYRTKAVHLLRPLITTSAASIHTNNPFAKCCGSAQNPNIGLKPYRDIVLIGPLMIPKEKFRIS